MTGAGGDERWSRLPTAGPKHPAVAQYFAIQNNSKPNPQRLIVLSGLWELESGLDAGLELIALLVSPERFRGNRAIDVFTRAERTGAPAYAVADRLATRISDRDSWDGLAAIAVSRQWQLTDVVLGDPALVLVLDGLEVLGNVGTAVRSAQAAGAAAVLLTNRRVRLSHPRLIHASMAASLTMPMLDCSIDEAAAWLHEYDVQVLGTDTRAQTTYKAMAYRSRVALVLGSERYGIHRDWAPHVEGSVSIPMSNGVDSLNVANAATILLFEIASRHRPAEFGG
ncbi:MAG TPA: TrmH family RNA methyltransferase [Mycobacteriales bacterium]|nr:TrmH family RNA methyltransferase [Mycobacteriales bacterium]